MITIDHKPDMQAYTVNQLTGKNWNSERATFIGKVGLEPDEGLYLATYSNITLLAAPHKTWDGEINVTVDRFVHIDIRIREMA